MGTIQEPVSVALFSGSNDFLKLENELQLFRLRMEHEFSGLLTVFAESTRDQQYPQQDLWLLKQAYTLHEGCDFTDLT